MARRWLATLALFACACTPSDAPSRFDHEYYDAFLALRSNFLVAAPVALDRHELRFDHRVDDVTVQCGVRIYDTGNTDVARFTREATVSALPNSWRTAGDLRRDGTGSDFPGVFSNDSGVQRPFCGLTPQAMGDLTNRFQDLWRRDQTIAYLWKQHIGGGVMSGAQTGERTYFAMFDSERHKLYTVFYVDVLQNESYYYRRSRDPAGR